MAVGSSATVLYLACDLLIAFVVAVDAIHKQVVEEARRTTQECIHVVKLHIETLATFRYRINIRVMHLLGENLSKQSPEVVGAAVNGMKDPLLIGAQAITCPQA